MRAVRLACTFHEMAESFLSDLGFELTNDPEEVGRFDSTFAEYKSQNGFFLLFGFDPYDGSSAAISCGRKWHYASQLPPPRRPARLSNRYFVLASRFGFDLPTSYELTPEESMGAIERMLDDTKTTLPTVMQRLTLDDLVHIEREEFGLQWLEEKYGWQPGLQVEEISPFPE